MSLAKSVAKWAESIHLNVGLSFNRPTTKCHWEDAVYAAHNCQISCLSACLSAYLSAKNALIQGCRPHILIEYSINSKDTFLVILQSLSLTVWYITKTQLIRPTALPALAPPDDVYDDHVLWVSGPSHSPSVCLQLNNKIQKI